MIKFRAWHKTLKKIFPVYEIMWPIHTCIHVCLTVGDLQQAYSIDQLDVMQWTGLQDRNNLDIYEGDILSLKEKNYTKWASHTDVRIRNLRCIVKKDINFYFAWIPKGLEYDDSLGGITINYLHLIPENEPEVIGNIYENRGLLNEI
jgi:uncharacterized phage protein (TIGR01671 family)